MFNLFLTYFEPLLGRLRGLSGLAHRVPSLSLHAGGGRAAAHLLSPLHPGAGQQTAAEGLRGAGGQEEEPLALSQPRAYMM